MSRKKARGEAAFEQFYENLYGDRWPGLREALIEGGAATAFSDGLEQPYYLDVASICAARALGAGPGQNVLDLCAAPGGKSLVIASQMRLAEPSDAPGELVCNERSSARRARLHRVLDDHLPDAARARVRITGNDATRWGLYEPEAYDRVLADVPCSSEQHVIQSASALAEWSPSRTRRLAQGAYAIACAAFDTLRPGGRLVYSTCALSPRENDEVVSRVIDRAAGHARLPAQVTGNVHAGLEPAAAETLPEGTERTSCGWLILPDRAAGAGPIYFAVVTKTD
jgi:16S rRNA C967 or C1407 C5-methylase (RsmB/RsmF family)